MALDNRGDNAWRFRVRSEGQTYTMNFKGTEREAKKAHGAFKVDIARGNIGTNENMRMHELCKIVYEEYVLTSCKAGTQRIYKQNYNLHILPALGSMKLSSIKPLHIQKLINEMSKTLKPNTIGNCMGSLGKTFSLAEKWGLLKESPFKHLDIPKAEKKTQSELLSMPEIKKLLEYYSKESNLLHKTAFYLAIGCGLRNSEIRGLTLTDIDYQNGTINIDKQIGEVRNEKGVIEEGVISPKTPSSTRKIYVPKFILDVLKEYIDSLPYIPTSKQLFWSHITRKPVSKHCLSKRFRYICDALEITPLRFHDLRHLQATLLIHSDINVQAISKRMGHSNVQTTLGVYTHSIEAVDKEVADTLETTLKNIVQ